MFLPGGRQAKKEAACVLVSRAAIAIIDVSIGKLDLEILEATDTMDQVAFPETIHEEVVDEKVRDAFERRWGVIVWNDPVNLMSYVVYVFQRVLKMSKQEATRHMLEVHNKGKSLVAQETRERAEFLVHQLQRFGLQATMELG